MMWSRRLLVVGLIAFLAALAGVFLGRALVDAPRANEAELHALLHKELRLSSEQRRKLDPVEARFKARRETLEREMRAANVELAKAIEAEHGYGPQVTAAIDHMHKVMGDMQKETLQHLFAMRDILDRDQAADFDKVVAGALTAEAR